jgi:hypothetical protein
VVSLAPSVIVWRYDKSIPLGTKVPRYFVPEVMVDGVDSAGFVTCRWGHGVGMLKRSLFIRLCTPTVS